jgi:RimJ/RimL family protein N-acetyltransferase
VAAIVALVPISLEHAPAIQALASDRRIAATSNVPHPYPPDGATAWIRFTMAQRAMGGEMDFAIFHGPTLVGVCGLLPADSATMTRYTTHLARGRRGEVGYWIGVPYWGHGYATAAAGELVRVAFEDVGLDCLCSSCLAQNGASLRVLQKVGFRMVGYGSHPGRKWTSADRFALFELTRDVWHSHQRERTARSTS